MQRFMPLRSNSTNRSPIVLPFHGFRPRIQHQVTATDPIVSLTVGRPLRNVLATPYQEPARCDTKEAPGSPVDVCSTP